MRLIPQELETVAGAAAALRRKDFSCRELVERCLNRIDERESALHAWVSVDRQGALRRAAELDADLAAGRPLGPLFGIPIGIKDIIDVAGFPTGAGSKLMAQTIASRDATLVRKLRDAGAVLLGKTVTTQFACFDPPPTCNPWNLDRTPGGSSSGSAAAVADGMCLAAIGSQTGGSITRPAAFCGVCGCKPTYGRVSLAGIVPLSPCMDHPGPIARTVGDLGLLLDIISGHDSEDPRSAADGYPPIGAVDAGARPPRLARLRGFFETGAQPAMNGALERALDRLQACGATLVAAPWPENFRDIHERHRIVLRYELANHHRRRFRSHRDDYLPGIAELIEDGLSISEASYRAALEHRATTIGQVGSIFGDADAAVCPAAIGPAPDRSTTGDPAFNSPWSYTGLPTVNFPIGLAEDGLPLGIQFVGRRFGEPELFRAARWCEAVIGKMGP